MQKYTLIDMHRDQNASTPRNLSLKLDALYGFEEAGRNSHLYEEGLRQAEDGRWASCHSRGRDERREGHEDGAQGDPEHQTVYGFVKARVEEVRGHDEHTRKDGEGGIDPLCHLHGKGLRAGEARHGGWGMYGCGVLDVILSWEKEGGESEEQHFFT